MASARASGRGAARPGHRGRSAAPASPGKAQLRSGQMAACAALLPIPWRHGVQWGPRQGPTVPVRDATGPLGRTTRGSEPVAWGSGRGRPASSRSRYCGVGCRGGLVSGLGRQQPRPRAPAARPPAPARRHRRPRVPATSAQSKSATGSGSPEPGMNCCATARPRLGSSRSAKRCGICGLW
jgi:hypothetical protein